MSPCASRAWQVRCHVEVTKIARYAHSLRIETVRVMKRSLLMYRLRRSERDSGGALRSATTVDRCGSEQPQPWRARYRSRGASSRCIDSRGAVREAPRSSPRARSLVTDHAPRGLRCWCVLVLWVSRSCGDSLEGVRVVAASRSGNEGSGVRGAVLTVYAAGGDLIWGLRHGRLSRFRVGSLTSRVVTSVWTRTQK